MATTFRAAKIVLLAHVLLGFLGGVTSTSAPSPEARTFRYLDACVEIASAISASSAVYYPSSSEYGLDIEHYANSSTQESVCSVEPGSAEDVGVILRIVKKTQTPFAVKGGGHAMNQGFSSTKGVHISMTRFDEVVYDASSGTVDVGPGLKWDDVYSALAEYNVVAVGGRVRGIGVAGFTLGGGYSWLTNQHGLALDTVKAYELVLPNGTITNVTSSSNPDLFFGLRGGFNNFGIVTKFTLQTFPQGQVWGGSILYLGDKLDALAKATANFSANNTDPKAQIITSFNSQSGTLIGSVNIFYDGPDQPEGIFDEFLAIEAFLADISTRSFLSLVQSAPVNATSDERGAYHTASVSNWSQNLLNVIMNETDFWGSSLGSLFPTGTLVSYAVEPFLTSLFSHGSDSAYPPSRTQGLFPLNLAFEWSDPSSDEYFLDAMRQSVATIQAAAVAEGQDVAHAALYGNYALAGTSIERIYTSNVDRLESIKARYDPDNVMGLAGGWKFSV
ncbi:hypothetical protein M0805_004536 [Coniferiporia weirii]|nr:hypothetical protein M0805_004536 [Coniferiporia weirii]